MTEQRLANLQSQLFSRLILKPYASQKEPFTFRLVIQGYSGGKADQRRGVPTVRW